MSHSSYPDWQQTARETYLRRTLKQRTAEEAKNQERNAGDAALLKAALGRCGIEAEPTGQFWERDGYTFLLQSSSVRNVVTNAIVVSHVRCASFSFYNPQYVIITNTSDEGLVDRMGEALTLVDEALKTLNELEQNDLLSLDHQTPEDRLIAALKEIFVARP
jgi:hypothetical protein